MNKINKRVTPFVISLVFLAFFLFVVTLVKSYGTWNTGYRINNTASAFVTRAGGACSIVTNGSGTDLFVPSNTTAEWDAFSTYKPAGVTIGGSCTGFDAASSAATNPDSSTLSWTHTVSGSNTVLIVGVAVRGNKVINTVTYNGVALTNIRGAWVGSDVRVQIWRLTSPASGAHTVLVTAAAATTMEGGAVSFSNASATAGVSSVGTGSLVTSSSVTVVSAANEIVVDAISMQSATTITANAGQTYVVYKVGTAGTLGMSIKTGSASTQMIWTFGSNYYAATALTVKPF